MTELPQDDQPAADLDDGVQPETETVWRDLADRGCDIAQGYLLSRPLPAQQATELISTWPATPPRVAVPAADIRS